MVSVLAQDHVFFMLKTSVPPRVTVSDSARVAYQRSQGHRCQNEEKSTEMWPCRPVKLSPKQPKAAGDDCRHADGCPTSVLAATATLTNLVWKHTCAPRDKSPHCSLIPGFVLLLSSSSERWAAARFFFPRSLNSSRFSSRFFNSFSRNVYYLRQG